MTRHQLYQGPRCPRCGGDHWPDDPQRDTMDRRLSWVRAMLVVIFVALAAAAGASSIGMTL